MITIRTECRKIMEWNIDRVAIGNFGLAAILHRVYATCHSKTPNAELHLVEYQIVPVFQRPREHIKQRKFRDHDKNEEKFKDLQRRRTRKKNQKRVVTALFLPISTLSMTILSQINVKLYCSNYQSWKNCHTMLGTWRPSWPTGGLRSTPGFQSSPSKSGNDHRSRSLSGVHEIWVHFACLAAIPSSFTAKDPFDCNCDRVEEFQDLAKSFL